MIGKILLALSLISLAVLSIGTALWPDNSAFWLSSGNQLYQHVRELLMAILAVQLITRPPRHVYFRVLAGAVALSVGVWALAATNSYSMNILDTLGFFSASIAIGITALERRPEEIPFTASGVQYSGWAARQ